LGRQQAGAGEPSVTEQFPAGHGREHDDHERTHIERGQPTQPALGGEVVAGEFVQRSVGFSVGERLPRLGDCTGGPVERVADQLAPRGGESGKGGRIDLSSGQHVLGVAAA